jgi:DNA-binding response OmpR family regulator
MAGLGIEPPGQLSARVAHKRWTESTGAHLLVFDPVLQGTRRAEGLGNDLAVRGWHVTVTQSPLDALFVLGRSDPEAVIIAPRAAELAPADLVRKFRDFSAALIVAAVDRATQATASELMLAGASAVVARPYSAETVWDVLRRFAVPLDGHTLVTYGPIEVDARAYTVRIDGERIADLPLKEFELLRSLMYRAPAVVTDDELREEIWAGAEAKPTDNTLALHAARVRNRLQGVADVRRVRGKGYSLTLR